MLDGWEPLPERVSALGGGVCEGAPGALCEAITSSLSLERKIGSIRCSERESKLRTVERSE